MYDAIAYEGKVKNIWTPKNQVVDMTIQIGLQSKLQTPFYIAFIDSDPNTSEKTAFSQAFDESGRFVGQKLFVGEDPFYDFGYHKIKIRGEYKKHNLDSIATFSADYGNCDGLTLLDNMKRIIKANNKSVDEVIKAINENRIQNTNKYHQGIMSSLDIPDLCLSKDDPEASVGDIRPISAITSDQRFLDIFKNIQKRRSGLQFQKQGINPGSIVFFKLRYPNYYTNI